MPESVQGNISFLEKSQAMNSANEFVTWMKSNISNTFTFDEGTSAERNQSSPYVTYSTLVFMYEWKQNMDKRGKLIN